VLGAETAAEHNIRFWMVCPTAWDADRMEIKGGPALDLLVERRIAVLGSDGNNYTASRAVEGV
jgi:hypothetical protein